MRKPPPRVPALALASLLFACNGGLEPQANCAAVAQICGTITFVGTPPDSTDWIRVVAYQTPPATAQQLFTFFGPSDAVPYANPTAEYRLSVPEGSYAWVIAVWKKLGTLTGDSANADSLLRQAGFYPDPNDANQYGVVVVPSTGVGEINMTVDFANMRTVADLFPVAPPPPPSPSSPRRPQP